MKLSYFFCLTKAPNITTAFVPTAENGTTVRLDIARFDPFRWRGENKYFCIHVAYSEANISSLGFSCKHLSFSNDHRYLGNIWPFYEGYWLYRFYKQINLSYNLEEYALESNICDELLISNFTSQDTSQQFYIHGLTPYSQFNVTILACNEVDCQNKTFFNFIKTPSELPICSTNFTLNVTSPYSIHVNASHLFQRCFNGKVLFMNISVVRNRTGKVLNKKSDANNPGVVFDQLKPYELVCIFSTVVNDIGEGPASSQICVRTHEAGKILS